MTTPHIPPVLRAEASKARSVRARLLRGGLGLLLGTLVAGPAAALDLIRFEITSRLTEGENRATVDARLALPGELYATPVRLDPGAEAPAEAAGSILTSLALWQAFLEDDEDRVLALWAEDERRMIRTVLADEEFRTVNRRLLGAYPYKDVIGRVVLQADRRYELLLVRRHDEPRELGVVESYVLEDGKWRATNALADDRRFDIIWAAFRSGDMVATELPGDAAPDQGSSTDQNGAAEQ
jgi:hypothetical protein